LRRVLEVCEGVFVKKERLRYLKLAQWKQLVDGAVEVQAWNLMDVPCESQTGLVFVDGRCG
jgi:hypothetical protein